MGNFHLQTGFLFANPSFISGAGRLLDLFGLFDEYNESLTEKQADNFALFSDWSMVGSDLCDAMAQYDYDAEIDPSAPDQQQVVLKR